MKKQIIIFTLVLSIALVYHSYARVDERERVYDSWTILQASDNYQEIITAYQKCVSNLDQFTLDALISGKIYHITEPDILTEIKDAGLINENLTQAFLAIILVKFNGYYTREDTSEIVLDAVLKVSKSYSAPMIVSQGTEIIQNPFEYFNDWVSNKKGIPFYLD